MKVKALIEKLQKCDPEAEVVTSGSDHSYIRVGRAQATTGADIEDDLYEWHGPEHAREGEVPVPVVVLE